MVELPPEELRYVGAGDFTAVGEEFVGHFKDRAGLESGNDVLDIGCGIGRMAIPLTEILSPSSRYFGFDIVSEAIDWCTDHISSQHPNFEFSHADLHNDTYNPAGKLYADDYTFPVEDESFDFVFATSVFTHMLPPATERYLHEIRRVLRPDGRGLLTFFIWNDETSQLAHEDKAIVDFPHEFGDFRTGSREQLEAVVAIHEDRLLELIQVCGLLTEGPIHRGSWPGRTEYVSFQDMLVITA